MILLIIGSFLASLYICCSPLHEKYQVLLWATGANLTLAALSGITGVLIFGARLHYRDWMPDWEHNDVGWSYGLAVIGSFALLTAGTLFLVEARRFKRKSEQY
ncbi:hypothetical protein QAD02_002211 [Eretmocerus hayati]|uniref:Uncharacterized protein n=1 Tax=Eretmocerus hayati TaxID=131215 RepID=A0ACC2NIN1_9HYME|nr:hypothetical protein QAD02_002211 [Eretmocerus hayati]